MLDIKLFRENPEIIKNSEKRRGRNTKLVDEVIKYDKLWRNILKKSEELKHQRNVVSEGINQLKKQGKSAKSKIAEMHAVVEDIKTNDSKAVKYLTKRDELRLQIGNLLDKSVPSGKDESDNKVIKKFGKFPKFSFKPKNHLELAETLGILDVERGAKVSGHGFLYLKRELAMLDLALQRFAIDFLLKKGFTLVEPPFMLNKKPLSGAVNVEEFKDTIYKIEGQDLYLIGSSEISLVPMFMGETIRADNLPLKICGISSNFRRELGAHGKYTKGLFRMHQFNKVEQIVFCHPKDSEKIFEEIQKNSEEMFKLLKLPFRVVNYCSRALGDKQAKQVDIELLMSDGKYRELGSCSNCTDYQARKLGITYVDGQEKNYVHILNNTGIATSRAMIGILETNQQKDGSIKIPSALWKYTGFKKIAPNKA